jgi:hypothetical protein
MDVEVKIFRISWLNGKGAEFLQKMASQGTQKMFSNELLEAILKEQYYTTRLLLPFFLHLLLITL